MQSTRPKPTGNNRGLAQAYDLRDVAAEEALALREIPAITLREHAIKATALKALGILWSEASERIRILRNRPLPGSLRPEKKAGKRKALTGPVYTEEPIVASMDSMNSNSLP